MFVSPMQSTCGSGRGPSTPWRTDEWAFEAKHGGVVPATVADDLTGTATYRGTAAGRYAVHQPAGGTSGAGSFTASARLEANFDSNTVFGQITGFSNDPGWEVTLKRGTINWRLASVWAWAI